MTLIRRTPLKRPRKKDSPTAQVIAEVAERDIRIAGGCVPKYLGAPGDCKDRWGHITRPDARETMTFNHVREHSGGMRRSEVRWMNAGCSFHNVQGWELGHTAELRDYLAAVS